MYKCLTGSQVYREGDYSIVPIRDEDKFPIMEWRNAQIDVLRQDRLLTVENQKEYFKNVVLPLFDQEYPKQLLFSFLLGDKLIGYGGLVHINWQDKRGEVSFLLDTERIASNELYEKEFSIYLTLLKQMAFKGAGFNRLHTEIYDIRPFHVSVVEKNGFILEGRMKNHVLIRGTYRDALIHGFLKEYWFEGNKPSGINALVTSISKKVPLLKSVKDALSRVGKENQLYGGDIAGDVIGKYFVDHFWKMPQLEDGVINDIISYCQAHQIKLILPTRDGELLFWAKHKRILAKQGITVLTADLEAVEKSLDKLAFYQELQRNGLPAIFTTTDINELPAAAAYVVKEQFGAGAINMGLRLGKEEAADHAGKLAHAIFQPYVTGKEYSVDIYITQQKAVKGVVVRTRDKVVAGESQITTTADKPLLEQLAKQLAGVLDLTGHVVLQVLEDENGAFHIIECNPRFGGASTLSIAFGLDSFYWSMLEVLNIDLSNYPFVKPVGAMQQIRFARDKHIYV